jgi:hypothetical protein
MFKFGAAIQTAWPPWTFKQTFSFAWQSNFATSVLKPLWRNCLEIAIVSYILTSTVERYDCSGNIQGPQPLYAFRLNDNPQPNLVMPWKTLRQAEDRDG